MLTLGGWAVARTVVLWPEPVVDLAETPAAPRVPASLLTRRADTIRSAGPVELSNALLIARRAARASQPNLILAMQAPRSGVPSRDAPASAVVEPSRETALKQKPAQPAATTLAATPHRLAAPSAIPVTPERARLRGDTWLIARPGGGDSLAFGQLGASQAGMRLTYAIDRARAVVLSARLSAPLRGRGREAALGVDWRPTRLPVHLLIEQRLPLDGGPVRPAAQLIGSVATEMPAGLALEIYAQAGAVHRRGGFADGAARVTKPLLTAKVVMIDIGAGGWGAAQRDATRVDVGPTLGVTLPARGGSVRLGLDYRFRVAGRARPGSGPAMTLGTSF